ncbi:bifunctional hydroxymethylpyrimidine kinase/phosphomethylpyrimidine kinase [Microbacterium sp. X-17]|uniref:bifunctional hydroxymethylpyrimidine kinase/phosphomethylpyrimidine kinase n=1 Tax=Microbacterium sp. X-17 TaxID=3144404 RepID=UPI0031F499A3
MLSIAGTDPTGGAGIHADLKSIAANGGYGMAVVTALVAQNTTEVRAIHTPPAGFLAEQLDAVSDDVTIDAVKIGMLGSRENAAVVAAWLARTVPPVVVLDPVLKASTGGDLGSGDLVGALRELLSGCDVITPNLDELAVLAGEPRASDWESAVGQALRLSEASGVAVLVTGGHLAGPASPDALVDAGNRLGTGRRIHEISAPRVATRNTHGTGCSLSAALATNRARLGDWIAALDTTKAWLTDSLASADDLDVGAGPGPLHHFHTSWRLQGLHGRGSSGRSK